MSIVEDNSSQGAGSLKSRYYKYLETLCTANGIDITSLKNGGIEVDTLEMFFGGLPALIGLRYFEKLRVLVLISQDISNLGPLSEVAESLEELWICEGPLKDLTGLETCKQLRRLYLYDCEIENGSAISHLTSLDVLWIQNNKLKSMKFLDSLQFLTMVKLGGEQFTDSVALSIEKWPVKLQNLDLDGNTLTSLKPLLGVCGCEVVRYFDVCSGKYVPNRLIRDDRQLAWISYQFPFLERLNRDVVTEKFTPVNTSIAETAWFDEYNRSTKTEREYWMSLDLVEKNAERIGEKLTSFVNSLGKASNVITKREGRRELAIKLQEQSQLRLKSLKKVKAATLQYERVFYYFSNYLLPSWRLESAYQSPVRELNKTETQALEDLLQEFCNKHDEPKLKLKFALTFIFSTGDLSRTEMEKWSHVESSSTSKLWEMKGVVELCDRRLTNDYCEEMKLYKNLIPLCNNAQNTEVFVLTPLMRVVKRSSDLHSNEDPINLESKVNYDSQENERMVKWEELELAAVCLIELQRTAQCQFDELHNWAVFDERFNEQLKKLKEVGLDLKLEKTIIQHEGSIDEDDENGDVGGESTSKGQKGSAGSYFDVDLAKYRWRTQPPAWNGRQLSLRNALELTIAYTRGSPLFEKAQFYKNLTCLDLGDLKINKLDGIENLCNLHCLNLANNKLTTVKKLRNLKALIFLDISGNNIAKIDDLPPLINELRASRNTLTCLGFCTKLQLLTRLNVARNKLKSLKGIEQSKLLQIIIASDNSIKLTNNEIEIFSNFPKLCMVDIIGNTTVEAENYRKRLLCLVPGLLSIDYEKVPTKERSHVVRKSGKVLTFEFIEKLFSDLENHTVLNLDNQSFQMIALDRNSTSKLQHITELNMSNNSLEHIYELVELKALKKLNLSNNQIVSLCSMDFGSIADVEMLPELQELDLSFNNLNCQSLARIGLEKLSSLRCLLLTGNQLSRFDGAQFDFPQLEEIDVSQNEIRSIRKKTLSHLLILNLADNKLKDIDGLEVPKIQSLNLSNNRIGSCAAIKNLKIMKDLKSLNFLGNPVIERRVYHEFIKGALKQLEELDSTTIQRRSQVITSNSREIVSTQRSSSDAATTMEPQPTINLPPLVKLANSQSSEVRRFTSMIQKSSSSSLDFIPTENHIIENVSGKMMGFARVQRQSTLPTPVKAPRSQSIEVSKLKFLPRSRSTFTDNFVIAGTRAVKHYRQ